MQRREIQPQPLFIQSRALAKDVPKDLPDIHNIKDFALLNGQTAASCLDTPCCDHAYAYQSRSCYDRYGATKVEGWVDVKLKILLSTIWIPCHASDVTTLFFCGDFSSKIQGH
ncbi:hypothetical protein BofuT4_P012250.1 [Botrytis cinerea T4]|uniref:Uncharacterized protein n=1 Tax=Botryotinia fuckeliana (strain T4) TaxID=999810 RepID=G2XSB2_BOTF4|nr:hypothetical protein BofuT4_P012250.1 [Botrytis cinerea T4]